MSAEFSKGWWLVHGPTRQGVHLVLRAPSLTSLGGVMLPCKAARVVA